MVTTFDDSSKRVVVIGGNISGLSTALCLGSKGIPTALYEEKIWSKPCGGGFGIGFSKELRSLGVAIPFKYVRWLVLADKHKKVEIVVPLAIVSRYKLQESLIEIAKKNKFIEVHLGTKLNFMRDFNTFQDINVVATGTSGFSRQALGKSLTDVGMFQYQLIQAKGDLENFDATIFYLLPKYQGYAWLFPAPEGKVDIGVGGLSKTADWDKELSKFIYWVDRTYGFKIKLAQKSRSWGIPIPINKPGKIARRYNNKFFVGVGDAIELPDSITAAGIEPAWFSGQLLGHSIKSASEINLKEYANSLEKKLSEANMTTIWARLGSKIARNLLMFSLIFSMVPTTLIKIMYSWQQLPSLPT